MRENAAVLDFSLSDAELAQLDALTTPASLATFRDLYRKCVVRDTPLAATGEGVRLHVTED